MCCFSQSVENVADTRIFARLSGLGSQYLVYEMSYKAKQPTAIILPLPTELPALETSVRFVSFEGYRDFFEDLGRAFPYVSHLSIGCASVTVDSKSVVLEVHDVGDFIASFVPTIDDFTRLDPQFAIPKSTWEKIPDYSDYGFAVFQLKALAGRPHPMAFEFSSRWNDRVFFPTVHIHDGEVHATESFDHQLYLQHAGFDSVASSYVDPMTRDSETSFVRSRRNLGEHCRTGASQGFLAPDLLLHRRDMHGDFPNRDQVFKIVGDPLKKSFSLRSLTRLLPFGLGAAAIAWLIRRRMRLRTNSVGG